MTMQRHAAWLDEPQEMKTFDVGKDEPLLMETTEDVKQQQKQNSEPSSAALQAADHEKVHVAQDVENQAGQTKTIDKFDQV